MAKNIEYKIIFLFLAIRVTKHTVVNVSRFIVHVSNLKFAWFCAICLDKAEKRKK